MFVSRFHSFVRPMNRSVGFIVCYLVVGMKASCEMTFAESWCCYFCLILTVEWGSAVWVGSFCFDMAELGTNFPKAACFTLKSCRTEIRFSILRHCRQIFGQSKFANHLNGFALRKTPRSRNNLLPTIGYFLMIYLFSQSLNGILYNISILRWWFFNFFFLVFFFFIFSSSKM